MLFRPSILLAAVLIVPILSNQSVADETYDALFQIPDDYETLPANVRAALEKHATKLFPEKDKMWRFALRDSIVDWQELQAHRCPRGMPEKTYKIIRQQCVKKYPESYFASLQLSEIKKDVDGYFKLIAFRWPRDIPTSKLRKIANDSHREYGTDYSMHYGSVLAGIRDYRLHRK